MKSFRPLQKSMALDTAHSADNAVSLFGVRDIRVSSISYLEELQKKNKTVNSSSSPRHLCVPVLLILANKCSLLFMFQEKPRRLCRQSRAPSWLGWVGKMPQKGE